MDTNKTPEFSTGYMDRAVRDLPGIIKQAKRDLGNVEYDCLVGTGFSGAAVIPALAMNLKVPWLLVRKESDDSHHGGGRLVGNLGERWLFVDDFVSSGETLKRVHGKVQNAADLHDKTTEFVGVWAYGWDNGEDGYRRPSDYDHTLNCEKFNCKCF